MTCVLLYQVYLFKLHGTCCHFSFININLNPSEKQSRTQSMPVRRLGAGHDSGETE